MEQSFIQVGPYTFVQAVHILLHGDKNEMVPIPNMFAIPGGKVIPVLKIQRWAKHNKHTVTQL
jgi:hypothetical protein